MPDIKKDAAGTVDFEEWYKWFEINIAIGKPDLATKSAIKDLTLVVYEAGKREILIKLKEFTEEYKDDEVFGFVVRGWLNAQGKFL